MVEYFDELRNQVGYLLSVKSLVTSAAQAQMNRISSLLLKSKTAELKNDEETHKVIVDEIWTTYDVDNSESLDTNEVRQFLHELYSDIRGAFEYSPDILEKIFFREIAVDEQGKVSKEALR